MALAPCCRERATRGERKKGDRGPAAARSYEYESLVGELSRLHIFATIGPPGGLHIFACTCNFRNLAPKPCLFSHTTPVCVRCHTSHPALRAGARVPARGAHRPDAPALAQDKPTSTPHGAYQERGRLSSLASWPSNEGAPARSRPPRHMPHDTHAVRQCAARQQLWPVSHRVTL